MDEIILILWIDDSLPSLLSLSGSLFWVEWMDTIDSLSFKLPFLSIKAKISNYISKVLHG